MKQLGGGGITTGVIHDSVTLYVDGQHLAWAPLREYSLNSRCSVDGNLETAYSAHEVVCAGSWQAWLVLLAVLALLLGCSSVTLTPCLFFCPDLRTLLETWPAAGVGDNLLT